ncbi:hypothetical protein SDC9_111228 [bioreactor metagenome]|uniref:Uncharacterized protein n=1 Tax=bioreactor metagenome TaxID=1076179 RepID=A0A645BG76_9ZZZZ
MHGDDQAAFHIEKISQHSVVQLRREDLQKADRASFVSHAEQIAAFELKGAGSDKILDGEAGGGQPVPRKAERLRCVHLENVVQQPEALRAVQRSGGDAEALEIVEDVDLDALQPGLGRFQPVRFDAERQVLGLDEAVVAFGKLVSEHFGVLRAQTVKIVALGWDGDAFRKAVPRRGEVQEGKLKPDGAVKIIEEVAPAIKDGGLVLVLVELIVDVLKLNGFRVIAVRHAADAIQEHPLKRDAVLRGFFLFIRPLSP